MGEKVSRDSSLKRLMPASFRLSPEPALTRVDGVGDGLDDRCGSR
jgi:hypothetical protein